MIPGAVLEVQWIRSGPRSRKISQPAQYAKSEEPTEEVRGSVVSRDLARLALGVSTENLHAAHDPYAAMSDAELPRSFSGWGSGPTEPTMQ